MTDAEINQIVTAVLRDRLAQFGFEHSEVTSETDFDGSPIIQVKAHYKDGPIRDSGQIVESVDAIRSRLIEEGDNRFVFLLNEYEGDEQDAEEEEETSGNGTV